MEYSPIRALNRTYALSNVRGKEAAIQEALLLNLSDNHFYMALLGHLYIDIDNVQAIYYYEKAYNLAKSWSDKKRLKNLINKLTYLKIYRVIYRLFLSLLQSQFKVCFIAPCHLRIVSRQKIMH
ncbi:MAG TPA: hypothetical protein PLU10_08940 [Chitinophagaceae bacterium]|nr:hypothetical protein [Chitinophagaceae bacterium]